MVIQWVEGHVSWDVCRLSIFKNLTTLRFHDFYFGVFEKIYLLRLQNFSNFLGHFNFLRDGLECSSSCCCSGDVYLLVQHFEFSNLRPVLFLNMTNLNSFRNGQIFKIFQIFRIFHILRNFYIFRII